MANCVPASPSEATPPQPPDVNITQTLDFIQRTHTCSLGGANVWFHVLEARFSSMSGRLQHVHTSISHFDSKCAAVVTDESTTPVSSCPPQNVAKTVFRAFTNEQKSLTLTLYYKHESSTGTLLVRGNGCPEWADEEFPMLEALVHTMLTSPSIPWQTQLQDIPFHFCPTTDAVDAASTNPVDPTYLESLTDEWSDDEVTISKRLNRSKSAAKGKVLRRRAAQFTPQRSANKTIHIRLGQLERVIEELPLKQQQDMATVVSLIADAKTVTKNDLRLLVSDKFDQLHTHINRLETRVADLESANTDLRSQNQSLKTAGHHPIRC